MKSVLKRIKPLYQKLGIEVLNPMQLAAIEAIAEKEDLVLLSPTGSGKTLAFLLPLIDRLDPSNIDLQALVIVPTRELAIQIEQVARDLGSGYKINAFYGGRSFSKDVRDLQHPAAVIIATPGRLMDHLSRGSFGVEGVGLIVLDEFDKSLEIGFEEDMSYILKRLTSRVQKVLTSATQKLEIPSFIDLKNPVSLDFLSEKKDQLKTILLKSTSSSRLESLTDALSHLDGKNGIIFCNFRDSVKELSEYFDHRNIAHGCFYGGLEQKDRERALIKFRNGTNDVLLATDLAARGLDIPDLDFIIHYELPPKPDEYIHRNGRTARMHSSGAAYILSDQHKNLPNFIEIDEEIEILKGSGRKSTGWSTVFISGGRRDKISKGDIAGLFFKQGQVDNSELGVIELKTDCAFVAVASSKAKMLVSKLNNVKLKKKKVRLKLL